MRGNVSVTTVNHRPYGFACFAPFQYLIHVTKLVQVVNWVIENIAAVCLARQFRILERN